MVICVTSIQLDEIMSHATWSRRLRYRLSVVRLSADEILGLPMSPDPPRPTVDRIRRRRPPVRRTPAPTPEARIIFGWPPERRRQE